jgi:hypothetical protein
MADDTKTEAPIAAEPVKPARRPHVAKAEPAVASPSGASTRSPVAGDVLLDVLGSDSIPPHAQAPVVMSIAGHPDLALFPGINRVSGAAWSVYVKHPGIVSRLPPADDVVDPPELAGDIVPISSLPRRADALVELIGRTYSLAGLAVLEEAERAVSGESMRGIVSAALVKQRAVMAKRAKPVKVEAPVVPRRRSR